MVTKVMVSHVQNHAVPSHVFQELYVRTLPVPTQDLFVGPVHSISMGMVKNVIEMRTKHAMTIPAHLLCPAKKFRIILDITVVTVPMDTWVMVVFVKHFVFHLVEMARSVLIMVSVDVGKGILVLTVTKQYVKLSVRMEASVISQTAASVHLVIQGNIVKQSYVPMDV